MKDLEKIYLDCICSDPRHIVRFMAFFEEKCPECSSMFFDVQLNCYNRWYKRIWVALGYIFGYKSKYGHWDGAEFDIDQLRKIRDGINEFELEVSRLHNNQTNK